MCCMAVRSAVMRDMTGLVTWPDFLKGAHRRKLHICSHRKSVFPRNGAKCFLIPAGGAPPDLLRSPFILFI